MSGKEYLRRIRRMSLEELILERETMERYIEMYEKKEDLSVVLKGNQDADILYIHTLKRMANVCEEIASKQLEQLHKKVLEQSREVNQ